MNDLSIWLSVAAVVISTVSLVISWYFGFRDRYKLVATSRFFPEYKHDRACVRVKVVNVGRRLVILRLFGGDHSDGGSTGTFLDKVEGGLYLKENEFFENTLYQHDMYSTAPEDDIAVYENLWFEDSRGHHHAVKDSPENIRKLLDSK